MIADRPLKGVAEQDVVGCAESSPCLRSAIGPPTEPRRCPHSRLFTVDLLKEATADKDAPCLATALAVVGKVVVGRVKLWLAVG